MSECVHCGKGGDLRPYGPGGANVCFPCAMETPERKQEAEDQFAECLGAAGPVAVLADVGPLPYVQAPRSARGKRGNP